MDIPGFARVTNFLHVQCIGQPLTQVYILYRSATAAVKIVTRRPVPTALTCPTPLEAAEAMMVGRALMAAAVVSTAGVVAGVMSVAKGEVTGVTRIWVVMSADTDGEVRMRGVVTAVVVAAPTPVMVGVPTFSPTSLHA